MNNRTDVIFGVNAVLEKLRAAPADIAEIILSQAAKRPALRAIAAQAHSLGLTVKYLPPAALDRLAEGQRHQGVVAKVASYVYSEFAELEKSAAAAGRQWILLLDGVTDPGNFGALLRTAEAVGIRDVIIPKDRSVGVTPTVVKASAGAIHYLRIYRVTNLRRTVSALKKLGFWTVGLHGSAPEAAYARSYPEKLAVVLGSEGTGIRPGILKECDYLVALPMRGKVSSLNVSVAGGIFMYELLRQAESIDKGATKSY